MRKNNRKIHRTFGAIIFYFCVTDRKNGKTAYSDEFFLVTLWTKRNNEEEKWDVYSLLYG
ncbi:hypothetical protein [Caviibacterium pharyngocola]|uniref:Uncharacterized protein n=1 Tax=Caviibacterium pharyngocola TaxID=28159 RepID=A0A2M8RZ69_9PAST|nr:hypothetical protein [Caviibacterium pharyngocola]PJG84176.1 hypothetical protein CVP04_00230 [Caviibacterium pharyngocola]